MIKSVKEIASSSNVPAPVFKFKSYVRGEWYYNDGQEIDFVTDGYSLYVPVVDRIPDLGELRGGHHHHNRDLDEIPTQRGVQATEDRISDDNQFMLLVSRGPQGIQGVQGKPGRDGKTPSVFARFDGKQMVFYTMEDIDGVPTTRRIAATNDLTGPAWKPEVINDTIVWRKSKDDEAPRSIPLDDLRAKEAPVLLRVNSDNTKREDETSGPANYIQWKYEGQDYWNNLISISELMNLTLAGVTIFPVENPETGKTEYHLGHKEVTKATYDSTPEGKQIITDVELGEVLFDAGKIPFPEYNYEYDIEFLKAENCDRKREIKAIQLELPKFVRSVNGIRPDAEGNVEIEIPDALSKEEADDLYQPKGDYQPAGDYIKKSDLKFEVREEENGRYLYVSMDNGTSWTKVMEATCACDHSEPVEECVVNSITLPNEVFGDIDQVICLEPQINSTGHCTDLQITWTSDNLDMPVENGCVTILDTGEGHVTATVGGKSATVTVIGREPQVDTTLTVDPTRLHFTADQTTHDTFHCTTNDPNGVTVEPNCNWVHLENVGDGVYKVTADVNQGAARECIITVTTADGTVSKTVTVNQDGHVEPEPTKYNVTIGNTCDADTAYITTTSGATSGSQTLNVDENTIVYFYTTKSGYNNITKQQMIKDNYTFVIDCNEWTPVQPTTYTVTTNKNGGNCSSKPDNLTISETQNGTYSSELTFDVGTTNTVYVKATKSGYVTKEWTVSVSDATTIVLTDCDWTPVTTPCSINSVSVTPDTKTLTVGESATLSATVSKSGDDCDGSVTWSSNNPNIATVNENGVVTAGNVAGTAVITATSTDDSSKEDTCVITIGALRTITVSNNTSNFAYAGISTADTTVSSNNSRTFNVAVSDDSRQFIVTPNSNLSEWYVYYYDNGEIVIGEHKSPASGVESWSEAIENLPFNNNSITIYISETDPDAVPVTGVSIANCVESPMYLGDTATLTAVITPSDATNKDVTWSSDSVSISVDENGHISADSIVGAGNHGATITVRTADGGFEATCGPIVVEEYRYRIHIYNESDWDFSGEIVRSNGSPDKVGRGETVYAGTITDPVDLGVTTTGLYLKLVPLPDTGLDVNDYYVEDDNNATHNIGMIAIPTGEIGTVVATYTIKKHDGGGGIPDEYGLITVGEDTAELELLCGSGNRQEATFTVERQPINAEGTIQWLPAHGFEYISFVDEYPTNTGQFDQGNSVCKVYANKATDSIPGGGYETITVKINNDDESAQTFKVYVPEFTVTPDGLTPNTQDKYEVNVNQEILLVSNSNSAGYRSPLPTGATINAQNVLTFSQAGEFTIYPYNTHTGCDADPLVFKVTNPNAFSINSIDILNNNGVQAVPVGTRSFNLPTWSTISMNITSPSDLDVEYSGELTSGDGIVGPQTIVAGTNDYSFDVFCVDNEEPQQILDPNADSGTFSFGGESFDVAWNGDFGEIGGNEGNS